MGSLASGDLDRYLDLLADDIEWWELGSREPVVGRAAVATLMAESDHVDVGGELHDVLANDEHLVALVHAHVATPTEELDASYAEVLHFNEDGRVTKRQIVPAGTWSGLSLLDLSGRTSDR